MSFNFHTTGNSFKPKVENTFLSKGGGGNTGYFRQRKKKKDEEDTSILASFLDDDKSDKKAFENISLLEENQGLIGKIKGFLGF